MSFLEDLRLRWLAEQSRYQALVDHVEALLKAEAQRRGIACSISGRTKAVDSLLKKALLKKYADPWNEIRDKAGVRVVATYRSTLAEVEEIVRECFALHEYDNKAAVAPVDRFGYQGIHFDVSVKPPSDLAELHCEIQLHTRAQNMWAEVSHQLSYKPSGEVEPTIARSIHRLVALMELFDKEVGESREALMNMPGYEEATMLAQLERHFYRFTARDFDRALSLEVIGSLKPVYTAEELAAFDRVMDQFVQQHGHKLDHIFKQYAADQRCNPLLFQPESLLTFERLEHNSFALEDQWNQVLPGDLLSSLANVWGTAV